MAGKELGNYNAFLKRAITIATGGDIDAEYKFSVPALNDPDLAVNAVLQFMVDTPSANGLQVRGWINDKEVFNYGPSSTTLTRPFHTIVPGNILKVSTPATGPNNTVRFKIVGGQGIFAVSEAVLWYKSAA